MRIIAPLLKLGLGGGAIYLAADQGLFSDNQKNTIEASKKLSNSIPGLHACLEKIPTGLSKSEIMNYWNYGVKATISALASLPTDSKELTSRGMQYIKEELKNQIQNVEKK